MPNLPQNKQLDITTVPGEYDAPTNEEDYRLYFETIGSLLGERNPHNTFVAKAMADQEILRQQMLNITSNVNPSQSTIIAQQHIPKPPRDFDGQIKSDYFTWKRTTESYSVYYSKEFSREKEKISWMEGIFKEKGLRCHHAQAQH
jgi:hypothetical protein